MTGVAWSRFQLPPGLPLFPRDCPPPILSQNLWRLLREPLDRFIEIKPMKKQTLRIIFTAMLSLGASCGVLAADNAATPTPQSAQNEVLVRSTQSWDETPLPVYPAGKPEVTIVKITIPPKSSLPWHTHPAINAAYVLSGSISIIRKDDGQRMHIGAGDAVVELVNTAHRGETGDEAAVLIVFYAGTKGMPLSVPLKQAKQAFAPKGGAPQAAPEPAETPLQQHEKGLEGSTFQQQKEH